MLVPVCMCSESGWVGWDGFGYIICTLLVEFVVFGGLDV